MSWENEPNSTKSPHQNNTEETARTTRQRNAYKLKKFGITEEEAQFFLFFVEIKFWQYQSKNLQMHISNVFILLSFV